MTQVIRSAERLPAPEPVGTPTRAEVAGFREMFSSLNPYRRPLVAALLVGFVATAASALQPLVVSDIVDNFSNGIPVEMGIALVALLLVNGGATALRQLILQRAGERFAFDTRARLVRRLYSLPLKQLERRDRGDLVSRVSGDVTQTRDILTSGIVDLVSQAVTVVVSLVMMALIDGVLLGVSVAVVAVILVTLVLIAQRTGPAGLRHQEAIGDLAASVSRALGSIRTIRATRSTSRESDASVQHATRALQAGLSIARLKAVVDSFAGISIQVLLIVVIGTGGLRVATGALSTGELSAFIMYLLLMATPLAMVGAVVSMLGEALGALTRIREIEAIPVERDVEQPPAAGTATATRTEPVFEFEDVYFSYSGEDRTDTDTDAAAGPSVLNGLSLSIAEGTTTAIVGLSGAGKSTVMALLERFYEPTRGRLWFRGQDVRGVSRDHVRSQMAYVDQDAAALSGSVRDNLRLGSPGRSDDECADLLVRVGLAKNEHAALLMLDDEVGELGSRLSGGERQRLAIARAYLSDSPIFLLDEVTSNLDSRNEMLIQDLVLRSPRRRTVVVIAHRFSTVISSDTIILLDGGRVSASGTHNELLERSPLYRDLAVHQLSAPMQERDTEKSAV